MKERPITFSGPMVRAIIDGRKTQTRRLVKPQPIGTERVIEGLGHVTHGMDPADDGSVWYVADCIRPGKEIPCPYGAPGDRLWVREAWWHDEPFHAECLDSVFYVADHPEGWHPYPGQDGVFSSWVKRSPIHMPRWASRLTLEVVSVRVERVQRITEADCFAELGWSPNGTYPAEFGYVRRGFAVAWDYIHDEGSWASNPWVWVIEFRRVEGGAR